ncbi:MAG: HAMP domain-containing histidine kinase [Bacteroidales bacterium]|jgi:signal transduction histidine kinase|nr:HAMP domain-containing histidine kinase [Bacteroidales bacterium]
MKTQIWRWALVISIIIVGGGILYFTNKLVNEFEIEEKKKIEIWAKGIKELNKIEGPSVDITFISDVIAGNTTIPVILADSSNNIIAFKNIDTTGRGYKIVEKKFAKMQNQEAPIVLHWLEDDINYVYYDTSILLTKLAYYPIIQFIIIILLLAIFYSIYRTMRNDEQNRVWVGMARETAHQLGTPVSSLMGWVELIKMGEGSEKVGLELEKDVMRLERIADRFSKIGSEPILKDENLIEILENGIDYISKRTSKKKIEISLLCDERDTIAKLNIQLFEWVIENLCKNAIDAMNGAGKLQILVDSKNRDYVAIDIKDTGKGISSKNRRNVFKPGFTTKQRGWGLGLSLAKRIIEDYHKGKIYVAASEINKGTTFRILLKKDK